MDRCSCEVVGMGDLSSFEEIEAKLVEVLRSEGGYATLDRLVYCSAELKEVGRDRLLEVASKSSRVRVSEHALYRYGDYQHRYIVVSLPDVEVPEVVRKRVIEE
jgi:hypothetical protein